MVMGRAGTSKRGEPSRGQPKTIRNKPFGAGYNLH